MTVSKKKKIKKDPNAKAKEASQQLMHSIVALVFDTHKDIPCAATYWAAIISDMRIELNRIEKWAEQANL